MKREARRLSVWICAVAVVALSTGCRNTAIGLKRDAEENSGKAAVQATEAAHRVSEATAQTARTATEAAEAAAQTLNVKTALIADKRLTAKNIDVDTDRRTNTVVLKGTVPTAEQKTIAEHIAAERAHGYRVKNELTVGN